ncbi:ABC transporter ATP-binding protein [Chryseobacterium sp. SC28]|nr:ABC transporter ATP-binding protein [Chryseobacterium sp. SC28]
MKFIKKYIAQNFSNFTFFYTIVRSRLLVVLSLAILTGLLDSLGLTMFLPLLQMSDGSSKVDLGNLNFINDFLQFFNIQLTVIKSLIILVLVFALKGIIIYKTGIYRVLTQQILTKKIRLNIINEFPTYSYQKFVSTDQGKIQNIFLGEINRLSSTYTNYVSMIQGAILIFIYMLFSFVVDWKFALLVCVGGFLSNLIFDRINKLTKEKSRNISQVNNAFANILIQYVSNFKYMKATGEILRYRKKVEEAIDKVQYENLQISILNNKVSAFREPMLIFIIAAVIGIQVYFFDARISLIMVSLLFFYRALIGIVNIQSSYNNTISNQGAIDNIMDFYKDMIKNREKVGKREYKGFKYDIKIRNLNFSYGNIPVLKNINLDICKNRTTALVGESGSGKTTLVNIIIKLLNPDSGEVLIDGVNLNEYNQFTYQQRIGYISQEPTVFNDTIYNNVTFWATPTEENLQKFQEAVKRASIAEFIESLPLKENSLLGNNGINLSGGQRQRISIARELFKDVEILILDEATSALDSETEKQIQQSIESLHGDTTIIIIAHRLSTIRNADEIFQLHKGEVIAKGNFNELIERSEVFRRMVLLQEL